MTKTVSFVPNQNTRIVHFVVHGALSAADVREVTHHIDVAVASHGSALVLMDARQAYGFDIDALLFKLRSPSHRRDSIAQLAIVGGDYWRAYARLAAAFLQSVKHFEPDADDAALTWLDAAAPVHGLLPGIAGWTPGARALSRRAPRSQSQLAPNIIGTGNISGRRSA